VREILGVSVETITASVVTTVTDYFWTFKAHWKLSLYRGTWATAEDVIVVRERSSHHAIKSPSGPDITTCPFYHAYIHVPFPKMQLRLTWLLQQVAVESQNNLAHFHINRTSPTCHTPRRNRDVQQALGFGQALSTWATSVGEAMQSFASVSAYPTNHMAAARFIFLPPILFEQPLASASSYANRPTGNGVCNTSNSSMSDDASCSSDPSMPISTSQLVNRSAINLLLSQCSVSLRAACGPAVFTSSASREPETEGLITQLEANILLGAGYAVRVWRQVAGGVAYVENLLRKQLQNAVGRVLHPSDFDAHMQHHNRRLFQDEYQPLPFVYSVRRSSEHGPEGVVRIETGDSFNPITTIHSVTGDTAQAALMKASTNSMSLMEQPLMTFALSAETRVSFSGAVHIHAWVNHIFSGEAAVQTLRLKATARQFSSFIVLVGRITGPTAFEPTGGAIIKDRDELDIPLHIATLPTAQEFQDAVSSLSPEQQSFATALRSMQLESTLLGVLVLHIKPQLEVLLNLPPDALTKEIALTQDLMDMFIKYQVSEHVHAIVYHSF
jgi:hypothetical protein